MNSNVTGSSQDPLSKSTMPGTSPSAPIGEETTTPQITPKSTTGTETVSTDFQVFEGTDLLDKGDVVTQQFLETSRWGPKDVYQAAAQLPSLQQPDPEGMSGPQPFEPSWQKAAKEFFKAALRDKLAQKMSEEYAGASTYETGGETVVLKKPKTATGIKEKAEGEEKQEGQPTLSLSDLQARLTVVMQTVMSGKLETLNPNDKKAVTEAVHETQAAWSLPSTWTPGSREVKDWTPIKTNTAAPVNVSEAQKVVLQLNLSELLGDLENAAKKVTDSLPPNDPNRIAVAKLILVLTTALRELKATLREMQLVDADISTKLAGAKFQQIKDRDKEIEEAAKKREEALEARRKQEKAGKIMKIIAPIISIAVTLIGIALLPFTAGASTALIIAGIAIGVAMTAYTILDATLNVTQRIISAFNDLLEKCFPGEDNAWKRTLLKALIISAVVAILIVAIVMTGGGAAANIAAQTTMQIAKQAFLETIKQLAIQATIIAIMSSNVIPELFSTFLLESGIIDKNDPKAKMIAEMVIMLVTMLVVMAALAKGGAGSAIKGVGKGISEAFSSVGRTVSHIADGIKELAKAIKAATEAAMAEIRELIKNMTKMLSQLLTTLRNLDVPEALGNAVDKMMKSAKQLKDYLSSGAFLEAIKKAPGKALEHLSELFDRFKNSADDLMQQLNELSMRLGKQVNKGIEEASKAVTAAIDKGIDYLASVPGKLTDHAKDVWEGLKSFTKKENIIDSFHSGLKMAGFSAEATSGIYVGLLGLKLSDLYKEIGELEKSEEVIKLLIKLFDQLLASYQDVISAHNEWLTSIQQTIDSAFASETQALNKASQVPA